MTVALPPGDPRMAALETHINGRRRYYARLSDNDVWLLIVERGLRLARDLPPTPLTAFQRTELTRFLLEADYAQYLRLHPITAVVPTIIRPTVPTIVRPTVPQLTIPIPIPTTVRQTVPIPTVIVPTIIPRPTAIIPAVPHTAQPNLPITVPLLPNGQPDTELETYLQRQYTYYRKLSLRRLVETVVEEDLDEEGVLAELPPGPVDPNMVDRDALIERLLRRDRDETLELRETGPGPIFPVPTTFRPIVPQPTVPVPTIIRPIIPPVTVTVPRPIIPPATVTVPRPISPRITGIIPTIPRPIIQPTVPITAQAAPPIPTVRIPTNIRPFIPPPPEGRRISPPRTITPPSPRTLILPPIRVTTVPIPRTPSPTTRVIAYAGERPIFEPQGIPAVPAPTGERTPINAFRTRVQNIPQGKVLNVSNITADGTARGVRLIIEPRGRTILHGIQGIPIVSNNSAAFITAMRLLYAANYYQIEPLILQLQAQYPGW